MALAGRHAGDVAIDREHRVPGRREHRRDGPADASAGARDERDRARSARRLRGSLHP